MSSKLKKIAKTKSAKQEIGDTKKALESIVSQVNQQFQVLSSVSENLLAAIQEQTYHSLVLTKLMVHKQELPSDGEEAIKVINDEIIKIKLITMLCHSLGRWGEQKKVEEQAKKEEVVDTKGMSVEHPKEAFVYGS